LNDKAQFSGVTMFDIPIAYFIFNRPQHTRESFDVIRKLRPSLLLIIADGPRPHIFSDVARCQEVRSIASNIDWPCEVRLNYSEENLGCKSRLTTGLNWVFDQVKWAIVLEDDIVPHFNFFNFGREMLIRYENTVEIMAITGDNFQRGLLRGDGSYYFSRYNHVWGWATWARSWKLNDPEIRFWPTFRGSPKWRSLFPDLVERHYWEKIFDRVYLGEIDTWDYSWTLSTWYADGLTVTPNVNLVKNIGFDSEGTHTNSANLISHDIDLAGAFTDYVPPTDIIRNCKADKFAFNYHFDGHDLRIVKKLQKLVIKGFKKYLSL
jgi:hypothetical protein